MFFKFILFFLLFINLSFAEFKITKYSENVVFTDYGREVEVEIGGDVKLEQNYYQNGWSYIFSDKQKIEIVEAKVIGKEYTTKFNGRQLVFEFDKTFNAEHLVIIFKYKETSEKSKYNRHEWVSIPEFAAGANGKLRVEVPNNFAIYSSNEKFNKNYKTFNWENVVPKEGFSDIFSLTLNKAKWKVRATTIIKANSNLDRLNVSIPSYFKYGNGTLQNYKIIAEGGDIKENKDTIDVDFSDYKGRSVRVDVVSDVLVDFNYNSWIKIGQLEGTKITPELSQNLQNVLFQIRKEYMNEQSPMYIKIAKWVNKTIQYDMDYFTKTMTDEQILQTKRGVCEHYAQLYNDLMRASNTPSIIVSGKSYDPEKNGFENHAWNMVFINGQWIGIDSTWGLYSGKLPVSHIFFNFKKNDGGELKWSSYNEDTTSIFEREVEFVIE